MRLIQLLQILCIIIAQNKIHSPYSIIKVIHLGGTDNWCSHTSVIQPAQCNLTHRNIVLLCQFFHAANNLQIIVLVGIILCADYFICLTALGIN